MGSLIIVLLTTRSVAIPGAPHCRRWAEASGVATGARYAGTPVRLADKADVVKPPSAGEPLYCNAYLQVVSVKQALIRVIAPSTARSGLRPSTTMRWTAFDQTCSRLTTLCRHSPETT